MMVQKIYLIAKIDSKEINQIGDDFLLIFIRLSLNSKDNVVEVFF